MEKVVHRWATKLVPLMGEESSEVGAEATLRLIDGDPVVHSVLVDRDLAETVNRAIEQADLREVEFHSEASGRLWVMWKGQPTEVGFWITAQGPEYLYSRVKKALRKCVSGKL
ncbi:MAG: hypothetical protein ABSA78_11355 [Candidatus Sulfotelmatobacter sp.]|jgi:hypothetical protein